MQRRDTHISTVWLSGDRAYKVKKPVRLPFVDFSTPGRRRAACLAEWRLNRRTAPALYLGVRPVLGPADAPSLGAPVGGDGVLPAGVMPGQVIDWVVEMRRFPPQAELATQARQGRLSVAQVDALAAHVAAFHGGLPPLLPAQAPRAATGWLCRGLQVLRGMRASWPGDWPGARWRALRRTWWGAARALVPWVRQRQAEGWVRDGHGDLHLGNLIALDGRVIAFDAIEFDDDLRHGDVMLDAAFTFMDLWARAGPAAAWRFIGGYVEQTGDWAGLRGLPVFAAYRALVRAYVTGLSPPQGPGEPGFQDYWALAERLLAPSPAPRLWVTMGVSGSGKSTVAAMLRDALAAQGRPVVRIRSDVERKRLMGRTPTERPRVEEVSRWYGPRATAQTYAHLQTVARALLRAGVGVVVDAACLRQAERTALRRVAQQAGAGFALIECTVSPETASARLLARRAADDDPSDATPAVLACQWHWREPVPADWADVHTVVRNDGDAQTLRVAVEALAGAAGVTPPDAPVPGGSCRLRA